MPEELSPRINDGSTINTWTGERYPAYVDIDLEANYKLDEIQVYTPSAGYSQYSVYTSMDGRDFEKLAEKSDKENCPAKGNLIKQIKKKHESYVSMWNISLNPPKH